MGDFRQDLLQEIGAALDRSRVVGLCAICGAMMANDEHRCKPDDEANRSIAVAFRHLLGDSPTKRAKGYAVR